MVNDLRTKIGQTLRSRAEMITGPRMSRKDLVLSEIWGSEDIVGRPSSVLFSTRASARTASRGPVCGAPRAPRPRPPPSPAPKSAATAAASRVAFAYLRRRRRRRRAAPRRRAIPREILVPDFRRSSSREEHYGLKEIEPRTDRNLNEIGGLQRQKTLAKVPSRAAVRAASRRPSPNPAPSATTTRPRRPTGRASASGPARGGAAGAAPRRSGAATGASLPPPPASSRPEEKILGTRACSWVYLLQQV